MRPCVTVLGHIWDSERKLTNLKVNGDTATGTVVYTDRKEEKREQPVEFRKIKGNWKIDPKFRAEGGQPKDKGKR